MDDIRYFAHQINFWWKKDYEKAESFLNEFLSEEGADRVDDLQSLVEATIIFYDGCYYLAEC